MDAVHFVILEGGDVYLHAREIAELIRMTGEQVVDGMIQQSISRETTSGFAQGTTVAVDAILRTERESVIELQRRTN